MRKSKFSPKTNVVAAAADNNTEAFENALSDLEDDFDYLLSGLDKLSRDGKETQRIAYNIILTASEAINNCIAQIADSVEQ